MGRTKRSWMLDRAKVALKQKHEVKYLKTRCKKLIEEFKEDRKQGGGRFGLYTKKGLVHRSTASVERICKALLKVLK